MSRVSPHITVTPPARPTPASSIVGRVLIETVAAGSKSQRKVLVMRRPGRRVVVELKGGSFGLDAKEKAIAGKTVKLEGTFVRKDLFRFTKAVLVKT
jgi:hypothetical protein